MRDNNTVASSYRLDMVQWGANATYHEAFNMIPCEVVFSQIARMGSTTKIPKEFFEKITNGKPSGDELLDTLWFDHYPLLPQVPLVKYLIYIFPM